MRRAQRRHAGRRRTLGESSGLVRANVGDSSERFEGIKLANDDVTCESEASAFVRAKCGPETHEQPWRAFLQRA